MICIDIFPLDANEQFLKDSRKMHFDLRTVLFRADQILHDYDTHAIITSFMREKGVHSTGRALDLRSRNLFREQCRNVEVLLNHEFPRNDRYHTCIWHDVGAGVHFHLQVPATE